MSNHKQTRRSVSISGDLYKALRDRCNDMNLAMSTYVEELARSSIGMDPRDPDIASRVVKPSLRTKTKPAPKVPEPKEPPRKASTPVPTPDPVTILPAPAPDPKESEDLLSEGSSPGVPDRPLPSDQNPPAEEELASPNRKLWDEEDRNRLAKPRSKTKDPGKPATPDAPDPVTAEVVAERKAYEESAKAHDDLAKERRKSFEAWAKKHSSSADELKPNGKRRNGNVHLL